MEFLMTYGWAILAAIIAIGVLAYFGVFSPGKFVPAAAVVSGPLYVNAWNVVDVGGLSDDTISLELKNNGGNTLTLQTTSSLSNFKVNGVDNSGCNNAGVTFSPLGGIVDPGAISTITFTCSFDTIASPGDKVKADISITYTKKGSQLSLSSSGTLTDTAI